MADLTLYTHPMSNGRIVRWALEEIGARYRVETVDLDRGVKTPAFLAINPMGKVPVLRHGDVIVTETAAICAYLADAFPEAGLAPPAGTPARGDWYRWLFFGAGPFDAATTLRVLGFETPDHLTGVAGWGSLEQVLDVLAARLDGRTWLLGDRSPWCAEPAAGW